MCATMASKSEAAMALIKSPGGTAQRMQARLKAVEMLVGNEGRQQPSSESVNQGRWQV
jgi:hypothetical protein